MNQAVRDSQIRSLGTDLGRLANHPRSAPCLESCDPARGSRHMSSLDLNRIPQFSRAGEQPAVGRYPETPGAAVIGLGRPVVSACLCRAAPPGRRVCGLGLFRRFRRRFRRASRRQVRRIARAKQTEVSYLVRSGQVCFPFFLRPGNLTGRVVLSVLQYRK